MRILLFILVFTSCNSTPSLESRVKAYMKDSVVVHLNDPSSYEFVSMTADTFKVKDYIHNLSDTTKLDTASSFMVEMRTMDNKKIDSLKKLNLDNIIHIEIAVKCRAKNAMGALILNTVNLKMIDNRIYYVD